MRSLLVVSANSAELSLALSFTRGQSLARHATLMLPAATHQRHAGSLPLPALPYASPDEVQRTVDELRPEVLLLFSGYGLVMTRLFTITLLEGLVNRVRERSGRVITSDPFLGLLPSLKRSDIDTTIIAPGHPGWQRWLLRAVVLIRGRAVSVPDLRAATHIYPTSVPDHQDGIPRAAFFNPHNLAPAGGAPGAPPRWLFVLSELEAACQARLHGHREFTEILLRMLRYAEEVGARATLFAPEPIVERLRSALPAVELLSHCPHAELEERMLAAEYLFTWDPFSFSNFPRLANERPVFPVDRGYFARVIKPFYAVARDSHFAGWEPNVQGQGLLFSPHVLSHLARTQREALRAARERWHASPTPDVVVAQVLGSAGSPG